MAEDGFDTLSGVALLHAEDLAECGLPPNEAGRLLKAVAVARWLDGLGMVRYNALEHIRRARHRLDTYQRAYMRAVPMRVLRAAEQHPRHADLSADEVLFL